MKEVLIKAIGLLQKSTEQNELLKIHKTELSSSLSKRVEQHLAKLQTNIMGKENCDMSRSNDLSLKRYQSINQINDYIVNEVPKLFMNQSND